MYTRGSGILLHISSLPSSGGIGDLGEAAYSFADILKNSSQRYWQILPLNPGNPQNGESPYFSSSAFAGNPLHICLEKLCSNGFLNSSDIRQPFFSNTGKVDFSAVRSYKYTALEKAYRTWKTNGVDPEFVSFCEEQSFWLEDYALFLTIGKQLGSWTWHSWPFLLKSHDTTELKEVYMSNYEDIEKICFYQFLLFRQWNELKRYCNNKGIEIIGDMPIYVSYESSDVWAHRSIFKIDKEGKPTGVSGVPPDYFSATGQLWNNPVYSWDNMRNVNYQWWCHRMKMMFSLYDIVRIDHFRGLVQFWEVNAGETTAINGTWQDVPTREFLNTLKQQALRFPVIAEDLGTITPDVREVMDEYGFPGMKILLFAFSEDNPDNPYLPHNYNKNCIVYTGTHDNNTVRGWLETEASDIEKRRVHTYLGAELSDEETVRELIRIAQASIADISIIPLQDLLFLGADTRMNHPAKSEGNWRWRVNPEQFEKIPVTLLRDYAKTYGRGG
jgi:4-alpha-glucanotransferase